MNKLRDRRGFTLTELLCAVLIVLLVSALLTVGVRFAGRTYNSSMQLSEAQELCSTLTSVISDKLRFCGTVTPGADGSLDHIFIQDLGSVEGEGAAFQVDADGQLTLGSTKQPASRPSAVTSASSRAKNFFILFSSIKCCSLARSSSPGRVQRHGTAKGAPYRLTV